MINKSSQELSTSIVLTGNNPSEEATRDQTVTTPLITTPKASSASNTTPPPQPSSTHTPNPSPYVPHKFTIQDHTILGFVIPILQEVILLITLECFKNYQEEIQFELAEAASKVIYEIQKGSR